MADEQKAAPKSDDKIERDRLVAEGAELVGHPSYVVAGALSDATAKTFTVEDAKKRVDRFLKREVRVEGDDDDEGGGG